MTPAETRPAVEIDEAARRGAALAPLLAWIMGATDAITLVAGGTYFGAFMAGNTTLLARTAALPDRMMASNAAALIVLFVIGVTVASLTIAYARRTGTFAVLIAQGLLLAAAAALLPARFGDGAALGAGVAAMAFAHALIALDDGRGPTGLPLTGALVRLGRGLAEAIAGGARTAWLPPLLLWAIVVVGGIAGALLAARIGWGAYWMPAIASLFAALSQWPRRRYAGPVRGPGGRR